MNNKIKKQAKIKVVIKDVEKSGFSTSALNELSRVGVKVGQIIEGRRFPESTGVGFTVGCSDCVAWIGVSCKIVND